MRIATINAPGNYWELIGPLQQDAVILDSDAKNLDFIHIFITTKTELIQLLPAAKMQINPAGMIWISWIKKSANLKTDVDENVIRKHALLNGLVDIKVCAVDEIWSGLKLVVRMKNRQALHTL